jgi:hypothetical protein
MYLISRKVNSFSLIETLVVMVLSSLIVSIIYFSYYTVSKYQMNLSSRLIDFNDKSELYFLLKKDFDRSKKIEAIDEESLRCNIERKGVEIQYIFSSSYIVRMQDGRVDTFKCNIDKPVFLWRGKQIIPPQGRIDELQIQLLDMAEPIQLSIHKQYDAASLVETVKQDTISERN